MTIIEVVIAGLILVISGLAVLSVVDAATRNTYRSQQSQVVVNRLEQEMERIKRLPYSQVALTQAPVHSNDTEDPNWRVSGSNYAINRDGTSPLPLVTDPTGGRVAPGPTPFTSRNVAGNVFHYVVAERNANCAAPATPCLKRVIVAARLNSTASGGTHPYQELQSQIYDPAAKRTSTGSPGGSDTTPWTFWLTDTACNFSSRQPIQVVNGTDGHPTHNTRATCGNANSGSKTGSNAGPPDLMYTQAPPLDPNFPSDNQPLYDYATDVEPSPGPTNTDKGLQEINGGTCNAISTLVDQIPVLGNLLDGNNYLKVHKWLSPKIPSGFNDILFHGTATLDLWTQTVNNGVYPGSICVWLFTRHLNILNIPIDTPVLGGSLDYFTYQQNPWPHGGWSEIHMPLAFPLGISLPIGYQLGVAVAVDSSQTGGALQFAYDAPSYDSRLQIDTTGSLPF